MSMQDTINAYNSIIVPKLIKNKVVAISTVVIMSLVYLVIGMVKPPKKLRHIPYFSYYSFIKSLIKKESNWDRSYRQRIPEIDKKEHQGLFLEMGLFGWQLSIANPIVAKRMLIKSELFPKADTTNVVQGTLIGKFLSGPNIALLNGDHWKSQRKIVIPAFRRSVPVKLFGRLTQEMFEVIETVGDNTVNVSDLIERWTLDVIGKAGFGFDFKAIRNKDNEWVTRYNIVNKGLSDPKYFFFPKLDSDLLWLLPERKKIHKEMDLFLKMIDGVIQERKNILLNDIENKDLEDNERSLLDLMIDSAEKSEDALDNEELKSNVCVFFRAGHDSTASAITFAIHYLAQNPDVQKKAREEAIGILGDEPEDVLPTVEETKKMVYINQVIKETLRVNPPALNTIGRVAAKDTELSGVFIPEGTPVFAKIFDIQHSEKVWKNADKFDPERFSENGEASKAAGEVLNWLPFGDGARQCIGMNFSLAEQRVLLSMLLRKYTWITPENSIHKNGVIVSGVGIVAPVELDIKFYKRY